ncbi:hypothetical protein F0562_018442 [Nyssa sinensis]|uniref:Uncharacterized protein n=1 Tax=Nyssa sinensis TaxID=561372 RepID=A0A5J4ZCN5_9ASTE|nr:hypothetical protein F0562_018442 [Nyssa sinensis]
MAILQTSLTAAGYYLCAAPGSKGTKVLGYCLTGSTFIRSETINLLRVAPESLQDLQGIANGDEQVKADAIRIGQYTDGQFPTDSKEFAKRTFYTVFMGSENRYVSLSNGKNWGRVENFRYNCCFICVDASLPALDQYVEERVDHMVDAGLLNEAYDIYNLNAD